MGEWISLARGGITGRVLTDLPTFCSAQNFAAKRGATRQQVGLHETGTVDGMGLIQKGEGEGLRYPGELLLLVVWLGIR